MRDRDKIIISLINFCAGCCGVYIRLHQSALGFIKTARVLVYRSQQPDLFREINMAALYGAIFFFVLSFLALWQGLGDVGS